MSALLSAAAIAAALLTIISCIAALGRLLRRIPVIDRVHHWIVEGWRRDREDRIIAVVVERLPPILDKTLAFNGTGSFRKDMRIFYSDVTAFMAESGATTTIDRRTQGEQQ